MPKEAKNQMVSFQYIHQAFLNPLQSGSKSTPGDLGLLILKERRWVNVLN